MYFALLELFLYIFLLFQSEIADWKLNQKNIRKLKVASIEE